MTELSVQVNNLEYENKVLKEELAKYREMVEGGETKLKNCSCCKHYVQHYGKSGNTYFELYEGHCTAGVPIKRGGKKKPAPDECCPCFELGTRRLHNL